MRAQWGEDQQRPPGQSISTHHRPFILAHVPANTKPPAARASVKQPGQLLEGYLIGFKPQPDAAILALVQARDGTLVGEETTITQILANIAYQPPQATTPTPPSVVGPPTTTPSPAPGPG